MKLKALEIMAFVFKQYVSYARVKWTNKFKHFFCSPEAKAQVSFSDQSFSVFVVHFFIFLRINFNQTWHRPSLDNGVYFVFR